MSTTKTNGYETMLMILFAVAVIVTLFVAAAHQLNIDITPSLKALFQKLSDTSTN